MLEETERMIIAAMYFDNKGWAFSLYDYEIRHYAAAIGLRETMDPLAEKYYNVSPYAVYRN